MAQWRTDSYEFKQPHNVHLYEMFMVADEKGNIINGANPTGRAVDAFGRIRSAQPYTLFDSFHRFQDNGKVTAANSTSGAVMSYNANGGFIECTLDTTANAFINRETSRVFAYQPGKALKHGEPVLTPKGWVNIENLHIGDQVFDGQGNITEVVGVYPQGIRKLYRVLFDDGTHVDADGDHQWVTIIRQNSKKGKKGQRRVITTQEMIDELGMIPPGSIRWRVPGPPVLNIIKQDVDIDPYTLGAILGDGHIGRCGAVQFTTADVEILEYIKCKQITKLNSKYGYGLRGLSQYTRKYNLHGKIFNTKHIPEEYLFNDEETRINVLRGLMDTDGWIEKDGCTYYATGSKQLAHDLAFLVRSLGGTAKIKTIEKTHYYTKTGIKIECSTSYRVVVISRINPFKISRKASKWKIKYRTSFDRYIHSFTEIDAEQATCIRVKSDDHTFLTRNHVVTHNSLQILQTFQMAPNKSNLRQRIGYFGNQNGFFLEVANNEVFFVRRDSINGTVRETRVNKTNWNYDTLDGSNTSVSHVNLDLSKPQIMFTDIEWLGVGSVRQGFIIDGKFRLAHMWHHANDIDYAPYMTTACLPLRAEIQNTSNTSSNSTMKIICSSVVSEGGFEPKGKLGVAARPLTSPKDLPTAGTFTPVISIRLKDSRSDAIVFIRTLEFFGITNNTNYRWKVTVGGQLSNTSWVSAGTDSSVEYDLSANSISGGTDIRSEYVSVSSGQKASLSQIPSTDIFKYQLERNSFLSTDKGIIYTISATGAGNGDDALGAIQWEEIT